MNKFRKGDQVIVISGSDKGKVGKISSVKKGRVVVEGVNLATVHKKPDSSQAGSIVKVEKAIDASNISHVENDKPIKIKFIYDSSSKEKYRASKKTGNRID